MTYSVTFGTFSPQTPPTEGYSQDSIIPKENMDYLKTRFKDEEGRLKDLLACLDTDEINGTKNPGMHEYNTIPAKRLGSILTSIAKYDCGKAQLIQLINDLKEENIKLKFVQPRKVEHEDEYALVSSKSLGNTPLTVYIAVQPDGPNPKSRHICSYTYSSEMIVPTELDETTDFCEKKSFEGYKCGHELSHAIAFVRFYKSQNPRLSGPDVGNQWGSNYNNRYKKECFLPREPDDYRDKALSMFDKPEEYRNLLGLGLSKTFEDPDVIIGEFDYLNELMEDKNGKNEDIIYIRMPYGDSSSWDESTALDICRKKHHQIYPFNPIKHTGGCILI